MTSRPQNVGIKAIEIYFPSQCVDQSELETHDGVGAGKYTIGFGQTRMSFCDDREDTYSFALTVVLRLLKSYSIDPDSIGRLEVGTETILDKSKSVKTVLMQLFGNNTNIEGVDTVNACYGGTNALFNAVNWVESSAWDGRDAIVVAADIALYAQGTARPTGGAGAVALLVGPDAPIVAEPGLRGTYMQHAYDFYKPDLTSEYPYVDGHYSVTCYTRALDAAYRDYCRREAAHHSRSTDVHSPHLSDGTDGMNGTNGTNGSNGTNGCNGTNGSHERVAALTPPKLLDRFDHVLFHAPNCKLVQKSYARLMYHDFLNDPDQASFASVPENVRTLDYERSLTDKVVEKTFMSLSKTQFDARVAPSIHVATMCGNMYCASVWGGLASLLAFADPAKLQIGARIGVFSYGSGLAASFFSFRLQADTGPIAKALDLSARLEARKVVSPATYDGMCELRKRAHLQKNYKPQGDSSTIASGVYYLEEVDDMFKRAYSIKA